MNRNIPISLLVLTCAALGSAAQWKPAEGPLMTRWAKDVTPENVWPQYPRPQMVRGNWTNLNGLWDYAITSADASQPQSWDGQILVPFCAESALSGVGRKVLPDQNLWYRRTFEAPAVKDGGRLLLHFDAVDWKTTVRVNGKEAGTHVGGFDPFTFDITDLVKAGTNEMVVQVWDPTDKGGQPRGKQVLNPGGIMYTAVTGIWQTVWLETVPANYIQSLKIIPDIDRKTVKVTVKTTKGGEVQVQAFDKGKSVTKRSGKAGEAIELMISKPKLWSPETPNLYDLKITLLDGRKTIDAVDSYFGMRKIEVKKDNEGVNRLFLNNEVVFQYGPLDQGWWPDGLFTPATYDAMIYDI
ncbi:MAG: beta-galactosidase, partial [Planctomycetes bacterium]|nr:beta-galactosidase [Planctomycetota bacterium]